ncbi:MAG: hypothetical protein WD847_15975 [Pirellulales bacterium]
MISVAVALAGTSCIAYWILHPLYRAANQRRLPTQFTLFDFLCLILLIQVPLAVIHWPDWPADTTLPRVVLSVFACGLSGAVWLAGVTRLSLAGVRNTWHRITFLALVLPLASFGSLAAAIIAVTLPQMAIELWDEPPTKVIVPILVAVEVCLAASLYLAARFTRWMMSRCETELADAIGASKMPAAPP